MSGRDSGNEESNETVTTSAKRGPTLSEHDTTKQKRRRRTTSCLSCQKSKSRCDFDLNGQSCRRCQALRIPCSRRNKEGNQDTGTHDESVIRDLMSRLEAQEQAMAETQVMLRDLSQRIVSSADDQRQPDRDEPAEPEHEWETDRMWKTASLAFKSAPVVVVRELGHGKPRNAARSCLPTDELDLIASGVLDEQTADELINAFFRYHNWLFYLGESKPLKSSREIRQASSFLHAVCCTNAAAYSRDTFGSPLHQELQKFAQRALGQTLLATPLSLEDLQGVLLMSDTQMSPTADGVPYIDSWNLTGFCANHAILTVNFSNIVQHIKDACVSKEDRESIRLWGAICLNHLQWAATTGRPSTIPASYIQQCNHILSFYEATMQDGILLAEIGLYSSLLQKSGSQPYLTGRAECTDFDAWKQKWGHLLELPTASMLLLSYFTANLIYIVRSLEDAGEGLSPATLSRGSKPDVSNSDEVGTRANSVHAVGESSSSRARLRASAVRYAKAALEVVLGMSSQLRESLSINRCLCIGYSQLVVAFYDEGQSGLTDEQCSDLVVRMEEWSQSIPGKPWVAKFCRLSRNLLVKRLQRKGVPVADLEPRNEHGGGAAGGSHSTIGLVEETFEQRAESGSSILETVSGEISPGFGGDMATFGALDAVPPDFPIMEYIFSSDFPSNFPDAWWS